MEPRHMLLLMRECDASVLMAMFMYPLVAASHLLC